MKLIDHFPEIKLFFKKDSFDSEKLKLLIDNIELKYPKYNDRQVALNLIKLEVLKYDFLSNEKKSSKFKLVSFKTESIEIFSKKIKISPNTIIHILSQNGINKKSEDFLSANEFEVIEDFIESRSRALKKQNKQFQRIVKSKIRTVKKSIYKGIPVYDDIKKNGMGKIIYIRKK